jgi:hypothetical protein
VRPLLGGFYAWKELGFPLVEVPEAYEPNTNPTQIAANGTV